MLKASLIGNLGADAVVRHHNGSQAIGFSVAHNERYVDSDGVVNEKTIWVNCTYWRSKETALINYLKKGQMVYLEGIPSVGVYRNKEGQPTADFKLRVTSIQLIGGRSDSEEQPAPGKGQAQANGKAQARAKAEPTPVDDMEVPDWIK